MSLLDYESNFSSLNLHQVGTRPSPHKVAMLLAVTDLIEDGTLTENRIEYSESLTRAFSSRFRDLKSEGDSLRPIYPFFHLRAEGFWHHQLKPAQSASYQGLDTVTTRKQVEDHIAYAYLDDELFELLHDQSVRSLLRAVLLENMTLTSDERRTRLQVKGWDWLECEACVQDYLNMLGKELRNESYSKTAHRNALMPKLQGRSRGAIERKHQNISAILIELGITYISGYKPLRNYQAQLRKAVLAQLAARSIGLEFISTLGDLGPSAETVNWHRVLDPDIPDKIALKEPLPRNFLARHVNYSQREAENRQLGARGEKFVVQFERFQLKHAGRKDLASEVEWSSKKLGDGLGYDVRSFQIGRNGVATEEELFIEVKTTNRGKYQPFYISQNEVEFSIEHQKNFHLYRVYDFHSQKRRLYRIPGRVQDHVQLNPVLYKSFVG